MLKMLLAVLLILPLAAFDAGDKYLSKIELYQKDSYYKNQVYAEHDWKSFYKLKDANAIIDPAKYDMHLLSAAVFFATNKWREQKGARPLQFSAGLRDAATVHSWQMVEKNFFDHYNNFTPALRSPEQRLKIYHAEKQANGENIDWNHTNI
ncbi:MAG TPA: CAP domain-containing protein, partial [Chitinophagales bacterium]|nr:CAP domain-containing protein [Chitinophagales bacterium]